nr:hypothetical protein [uncultured Bacillus sp.]
MDNRKERLKESILHSILIVILAFIFLAFFILKINHVVLLITAIIGMAYLLIYVKKPFNKNDLIVNGVFCMLAVLLCGVLIGRYIPIASAIGIGMAVGIVDVLSFTKKGKNTANAKVMRNKPLMSKLIVYGISFKDQSPVPTKGLGDFMYYAILLSALFQFSKSTTILFLGCFAVFLGCVINWIIVCFIYKKPWYKGFPATIIPFIFLIPLYIFSGIS